MAKVTINLDQIEHNCDALLEANIELANQTQLKGFERMLVLARIAHIYEQMILRAPMSAHDRAEYERVRALIIERAEQTRAQNLAEEASKVNAEGGSA